MTLRLNLGNYLQQRNITAYRLVNEVKGRVAPNTIYSLARRPAQRIDLNTVDEVLRALERLTGGKVEITEMLEQAQQSGDDEAELTYWKLLAQMPPYDPNTHPMFRPGGRKRIKIGSTPSIAEMVSEDRERSVS